MLLAKLIKPWVAALLAVEVAVEVAVEARAAYELAALAALYAKEFAPEYAIALSTLDPTPFVNASKYMFAILL